MVQPREEVLPHRCHPNLPRTSAWHLSGDDHQKALAAFLLFQKAAEAESVTLGLIREMVTSLEQARRIGELG